MDQLLRTRGGLQALPGLLEDLHVRRPLIVTGKHFAERAAALVPDAPVFGGYHPNPAWEDAATAVALYRENACDGLVSIGGGSAMDTAKAVKAMLLAADEAAALRCDFGNQPVQHIAVPATAGSGAETTPFAVLYKEGIKFSLSHPVLLPDGVVLDPSLLASLPDYHRKSCMLDALAQGIESWWSKNATEESRVHAYLAVTGVIAHIRPYLAGDAKAAAAMLRAAYESGRAITITRTTAPHAMSYGLTKLGYAHGHACMLTLPHLWSFAEATPEAMPALQEMANALHLGHEMIVPRLLKGLLIDIGMEPKGLPEKAVIDELAAGVKPAKLASHPAPLNDDLIKRTYRLALTPVRDPERQACLDIWRYYEL